MNKELDALEQSENIKILYACESGSRAWGFTTTNSDFDVRYIYCRPVKDYITVFPARDVIDGHIPSDIMDFSGWDVKKFLYLFSKSNTQCFEWLQSPIVYRASFRFVSAVRDLRGYLWNPLSAYHSYRGTHRHHMHEYNIKPTSKNLIHALRPHLCALWIEKVGSIPNMTILDIVKNLYSVGRISSEEYMLINDFITSYKMSWTLTETGDVVQFISDNPLNVTPNIAAHDRAMSDSELNQILYDIVSTTDDQIS